MSEASSSYGHWTFEGCWFWFDLMINDIMWKPLTEHIADTYICLTLFVTKSAVYLCMVDSKIMRKSKIRIIINAYIFVLIITWKKTMCENLHICSPKTSAHHFGKSNWTQLPWRTQHNITHANITTWLQIVRALVIQSIDNNLCPISPTGLRFLKVIEIMNNSQQNGL